VLALDEYGRERGDLGNEVCSVLEPLDICPEGCDPAQEMCMAFPAPNPFETNPPIPGQACENIGLAGADPEAEIPQVDAAVMGENGPGTDGGVASADAGSGANGGNGDDDDKESNAPTCSSVDGQPVVPLFFLAFIGLLIRRRRR
jgi:hypothetical protein